MVCDSILSVQEARVLYSGGILLSVLWIFWYLGKRAKYPQLYDSVQLVLTLVIVVSLYAGIVPAIYVITRCVWFGQ